jgi:hypothetical protein
MLNLTSQLILFRIYRNSLQINPNLCRLLVSHLGFREKIIEVTLHNFLHYTLTKIEKREGTRDT